MPDMFSALFDHSPNPMWIYEIPSLRILKVNEAAVSAYGYTEQEFLTMAINDVRPRFDPSKANEYIIESANPNIYAGVWKHQHKNGDPIYAEINLHPIKHAGQDCSVIIAADMTDKIQSQKESNIREQFLNSLIDSQTNFLIRIDTDGEYTFANRQFLKAFGYKANEIIGRHFSFTSVPEDVASCEAAFKKCISTPGKVIHLTHKKMGKSGVFHDTQWEFISITNDSGEVTEIQGIGHDITHKKISEQEVINIKNNLEGLIDNTDDLIWSIDREKRYVYINKAFKETLNQQTGWVAIEGDPAYNKTLADVYKEEMMVEWGGYYDRALNGEKYFITKQSVNPATGKQQFYETYFNPIYNTTGDVIAVGCFSRNITDRLKTEKALIDQNNRLKQIATLSSHELRRPVASMLGLINIIDNENFSNPANKEIIGHLFTVCTEIDTVIRQIVDHTFTTDLNIGYGTLKEKED
jgi:PAS domain S-box-containing protein